MAAAIAWGGGGIIDHSNDESGHSRSFKRPDPVPRDPPFGRCIGTLKSIWRDLTKLLKIVEIPLTEQFGLPKKVTDDTFNEWKMIQYKNVEICKGISQKWRNEILPFLDRIQPILDKMDFNSQETTIEYDYDTLNVIWYGISGSIEIYSSRYHKSLRYMGFEHQLKLWHAIRRLTDIVEHRLLHAA